MQQGFLVLDFGSQYTWLIARRFRELGYYSEIASYDEPLENIRKKKTLWNYYQRRPFFCFRTRFS